MGFSDQIKKARNEMIKEADEYRKAVTISLFGSIIKATPVREGRLRGNWQTNEGSPKTGELDRVDPTGSDTINEMTDEVNQTKPDTVVHMTNNLPYSVPQENKQAMVGRNLARITQILRSKQ